jgi:hypothetical protein
VSPVSSTDELELARDELVGGAVAIAAITQVPCRGGSSEGAQGAQTAGRALVMRTVSSPQ